MSGTLHRLARRGLRPAMGETCELCADPIDERHGHLVDIGERRLLCACRPCALLFTSDGAGGERFRAVPETVRQVTPGSITSVMWDTLSIPVSTAFFFRNSGLGEVVALYPGPAGPIESQLTLDAWTHVEAASAEVAAMAHDVEALLVRAEPDPAGAVEPEAFVVPIDRCYELSGRLRAVWQGIDGGQDARDLLNDVFQGLGAEALKGSR